MRAYTEIFWGGVAALFLAAACGSEEGGSATDGIFGNDAEDGGGASGGSSFGDPAVPVTPPESELEESFRQPVVSGTVLLSANPQTNRIALIDAGTLDISVVDGGNGPTYLAPLAAGPTSGGALVTNVRSENATVLLLTEDGGVTASLVDLQAGASAWATGSVGRHAVSWSRFADGLLGPGDGYQDIMVLSLEGEQISTKQLSVGYRPSQVQLSADESRAYAVSEPGITVVDLSLDVPDVKREIFLPESTGVRDVSITPGGQLAFVRLEGQSEILVVETESGDSRVIELPGVVTDLDLSADGTTAVAVMRAPALETSPAEPSGDAGAAGAAGAAGGGNPDPEPATPISQIAVFSVEEVLAGGDRYQLAETGEFVGSVVLSPSGDAAVLFTNAVPSPRAVLMDTRSLELRTVDVKVPVQAGFIAEGGSYAVLLLAGAGTVGAFAVVPLGESRPIRIQGMAAAPRFVTLTDDRALIASRGSSGVLAEAFLARYPELSVDRHELPSTPLSTGVVPEAGQAFVAQEHPEGRVTFIDLGTGQPRTVTGFELASRVVDE